MAAKRLGFVLTLVLVAAVSAHSQTLYVSAYNSNTVSKVDQAGTVSLFVANISRAADPLISVSGDLFVLNGGYDGTVQRITPGGSVSTFVSGLGAVAGIAQSSNGTFYFAEYSTGEIVSLSGNSLVDVANVGPSSNPQWLAFDSSGNLYTSSVNLGTIFRVTPGGAVSSFVSGLDEPEQMLFDSSGNMYEANWGNGTVDKVTPNLTGPPTVTPFASGLGNPDALIFNSASETFYVTDTSSGNVDKINSLGQVSVFATGFNDPSGLAIAPDVHSTPEPGTVALLNTGLVCSVLLLRRNRKSKHTV